MFSTIFYWVVVCAAILWGLWSLVWSIVYISKHENGNLWIFAIINLISSIVLGLIYWIYTSQDYQWYWFASKRADIGWIAYVFIAYLVLVVFQFVLGFTKKTKNA